MSSAAPAESAPAFLLHSNKEGTMKFKTKLITLVVAFLAAISFAVPSQVNAAKGDQGVDWSRYQEITVSLAMLLTSSASLKSVAIVVTAHTSKPRTRHRLHRRLPLASEHTHISGGRISTTRIWPSKCLDHFLPEIQREKGRLLHWTMKPDHQTQQPYYGH